MGITVGGKGGGKSLLPLETSIATSGTLTLAFDRASGRDYNITGANAPTGNITFTESGSTNCAIAILLDKNASYTVSFPSTWEQIGSGGLTNGSRHLITVFKAFSKTYYQILDTYAIPDETSPTISTTLATEINAIEVMFDEVVTSTTAGWSFEKSSDGVTWTTLTVTAVSGSGSNVLKFAITEALADTEQFRLSYDPATGDCVDGSDNELATQTDTMVHNLVPATIVRDFSAVNPFDGTSEFVNSGTTGQSELVSTHEIWSKLSMTDGNPTATQTLYGARDAGGTANDILVGLAVDTTGKLVARLGDGDETTVARTANSVIPDGSTGNFVTRISWAAQQMAVEYNGTSQSLDATLTGNTSGMNTGAGYSGFASTVNIYLGAENNNGTAQGFMAGSYVYWAIFDRTLTAAQATALKTYLGL